MFIWQYRSQQTSGPSPVGTVQILMGIILVVAGAVIVMFPRVLAYIVAGIIIMAGLSMIAAGWQFRRAIRPPRPNDMDLLD
jgi:hypothetical protein